MLIRRLITYSLLSLVALGGFFGNVHIETDHQDNRVVSISYEGNGAYANVTNTTTIAGVEAASKGDPAAAAKATSADQLKMWNSVIDSLNIILGVITAIVSPAIMFAGWLMSPDWTSGDLFGLRTPMYTLWVTVSNIVYFVYAILLILIALGTMFGKESFSYKVMLPKLALGILMVPFTWWFVQWTISLSSVVTASVITIPAETMKSKAGTKSWADVPSIPTNITIDETSADPTTKKPIVTCDQGGSACIAPSVFLTKASGMYGYMMVYAYSVFKFQEVTELPRGADILKAGLGIAHQGILAAIMFLVFGLLTLALVAMLLVRAMKLWIYAIFSPLFTFQFVAGASMMGGDKDTFTIKEFVGLCFVPAIVGLSLSFGLILINAVSSADLGASQKKCENIQTGCEIVSIMGNPENTITRRISGDAPNAITENIVKFGGITMTFKGKAGSGNDPATVAASTNAVTGVLNSAGGIFGTLVIDIIALIFIWMAFMAAKNVSKAVQVAVKPFEDIGNQVGNLAKSIPKYTPIPGLGMSANSMGKVVTNAENAMIGASDKKFKESAAGKLFGGDKVVAQVDERKLAEAMNAVKRPDDITNLKIMGEQIEKQPPTAEIENSSMFKNVAELVKKFENRPQKEEALRNMGYSQENAQKIVEQLGKKTNGEFDRNDVTLVTALKSRIGTPAGGAPGSSGTAFTATDIKGEKDRMEIKIDNIKMQMNTNGSGISALSDDSKKKLAEIMKALTEDEFKDKFSGISDPAIKAIVEEAKKDQRKFKVKTV